ncbi:hypothetical protein QUA16_14645 [Microcoleus sp. S13_C3]
MLYASERKIAWIFAHYNSMGDKSGEYGGNNFTWEPIDTIKKMAASAL